MRAWWYVPFLSGCALLTFLGGLHDLGAVMFAGILYRRAPRMAWQGAKNIATLARFAIWKVRTWRR